MASVDKSNFGYNVDINECLLYISIRITNVVSQQVWRCDVPLVEIERYFPIRISNFTNQFQELDDIIGETLKVSYMMFRDELIFVQIKPDARLIFIPIVPLPPSHSQIKDKTLILAELMKFASIPQKRKRDTQQETQKSIKFLESQRASHTPRVTPRVTPRAQRVTREDQDVRDNQCSRRPVKRKAPNVVDMQKTIDELKSIIGDMSKTIDILNWSRAEQPLNSPVVQLPDSFNYEMQNSIADSFIA